MYLLKRPDIFYYYKKKTKSSILFIIDVYSNTWGIQKFCNILVMWTLDALSTRLWDADLTWY